MQENTTTNDINRIMTERPVSLLLPVLRRLLGHCLMLPLCGVLGMIGPGVCSVVLCVISNLIISSQMCFTLCVFLAIVRVSVFCLFKSFY